MPASPPPPEPSLEEVLESVLEDAGLGWWHLDLGTNTTRRSPRHDALFGYTQLLPSWSYETFVEHLHPEDRARVEAVFHAALTGGEEYAADLRVVWPDGSVHWLFTRGRFVLDAQGRQVSVGGVMGDITQAKEAELRAVAHLAEAAALLDGTGDAVVGTRRDGTVNRWNAGSSHLFGRTGDEVLESSWLDVVPLTSHRALGLAVARALQGLTTRDVEGLLERPDGDPVELSFTVSPVVDESGVSGASLIGRDVSATRRLERELEHRALHDALTGLPNRTLLLDRLGTALLAARRRSAPLAVLFFDLDGFKGVNDVAGHTVGDALLAEVARRLSSALRAGDTLARFGGDEFVVLCPETDAEEAQEVAGRLHACLVAPVDLDGARYYVPASAGMTVYDVTEELTVNAVPSLAQRLVGEADLAMYEAKAAGSGSTRSFHTRMATRARDALSITGELREALADGGLELHYQPVVSLQTGAPLGVEALARWRDQGRRVIGPDVFVPLAERAGLSPQLDAWAVRQALSDSEVLRRSGALGPQDAMAVNVSARVVQDGGLVALVRDAAGGRPLDGLVLEVTETAVLGDTQTALRDLRALHALGVRVSVDDFGTGQSSLAYLSLLPLSVLKIDKSFVNGMDRSFADLAIVRAVLGLAQDMGVFVVAEGVETAEQRDRLTELGCSAAQGWLWSPALPLQEVEQWLLDRRRPPLSGPPG